MSGGLAIMDPDDGGVLGPVTKVVVLSVGVSDHHKEGSPIHDCWCRISNVNKETVKPRVL